MKSVGDTGVVVGLHRLALGLRSVAGHLALDACGLCVTGQVGVGQLVLVGEEQVVHRPEPVAGRLGGQCGGERERVLGEDREVPEDQPHRAVRAVDELAQDGLGGAAVRALEVAVLEDGGGCVGRAVHVSVEIDCHATQRRHCRVEEPHVPQGPLP
jgi:hypothetical protein